MWEVQSNRGFTYFERQVVQRGLPSRLALAIVIYRTWPWFVAVGLFLGNFSAADSPTHIASMDDAGAECAGRSGITFSAKCTRPTREQLRYSAH